MPDSGPVEQGEDLPDDGGDLPLYLQVASTLRTAIIRGIYPVGSRIPTEDELCKRFDVSRHTIREALRQLRASGLISSRHGSRPIVTPPSPSGDPPLFAAEVGEEFFDYIIGTKLSIETMDMRPLPRDIAVQLAVDLKEQWLYVRGYRQSLDRDASTCLNEYFITARFATVGRLLARHVGPIMPLLEDLFNERITRITRSLSSIPTPPEQAQLFGIAPGSPALRILTRCATADGRIAMINNSMHPSGAITYSLSRLGTRPV